MKKIKTITHITVGSAPRNGTDVEVIGKISEGYLIDFQVNRYAHNNWDSLTFTGNQFAALQRRLQKFLEIVEEFNNEKN